MKKLLLAILFAAVLAGCGEKELTIDASSPESLKTSTQAIYKSLQGEEAEKFKQAMQHVAMAASIVEKNETERVKAIDKLVGGKTGKEIIELDNKMQKAP
ncbi:DUF6694 family lipoprotein [Xenorhabdus bovienii]|uniref:DUF6694 family lipoprotein n=1 Tax=Xenorhabdus bovienii TaxID=40576 RepID=UPI00237C7DCF|nr:DUF6694 family lipoprotein [Xenorhabdus bovienii]MDE1484455.1 lipoprotein [Xenorhabdus bovienii]MDE9537210.1 lipoprotein [Xenorhabdus bovienii]MDE9589563.1 lipoprotein [Xenorhabdus bovienii]